MRRVGISPGRAAESATNLDAWKRAGAKVHEMPASTDEGEFTTATGRPGHDGSDRRHTVFSGIAHVAIVYGIACNCAADVRLERCVNDRNTSFR
jgi:hypothetical protein